MTQPKSFKTFFALGLFALLLSVGASVHAAISVGPAGSGNITFTTAPAASDWSTRSLVTAGNTFITAAALDTAVNTNTSAMITAALVNATGNPPGGNALAMYNTGLQHILTRPTGNGATLLMATLQNDSGAARSEVMIGYDLTWNPQTTAEQSQAHRVYYSLSGGADSWIPLEALSGAVGSLSTNLPLSSTWAVGAPLYLIWADDNADPGTDGAFIIDNFSASFGLTPPNVLQDPSPVTVTQCGSATFSAVVDGSRPMTFEWRKNGVAIVGNPSAATDTLTLNNVQPSDAGQYSLFAQNSVGSDTSAAAQLTVNADTTPPSIRYVLADSVDHTAFTVVFTEALNTNDPGTLMDAFNWSVTDPSANNLEISTFNLVNNTRIDFTTVNPRVDGVAYNLNISSGVIGACDGVEAGPLTSPVLVPGSPIMTVTDVWKYNQDGVDLGSAWLASNYDDSTWASGPGVFDAKDVQRNTVGGQNVGTQLSLTNANFPLQTARNPTYYFRTHLDYPAGASADLIQVRPFIDDHYVLYFNGVEAHRVGVPVGNTFAQYSGGTSVGDGGFTGPFTISATALHTGDNVIEVYLKQQAPGSSDITFGLELTPLVTVLTVEPCSITSQPQGTNVNEGQRVTLSVVSDGTSLTYQWQKNNVDIPGATAASYVITNAVPGDAGTYRVAVQNTQSLCVSDPAVVTVVADNTAPTVVSSIGLLAPTKIEIRFSEAVNLADAENEANYTLNGVNPSDATFTNGMVILTTAARAAATSYTITVANIRDTSAAQNTMAAYSDLLAQEVALTAINSTWRYEQSNSLDGVSWQVVGYNDSAWPSGPGLLGLESATHTNAPLIGTPLTVSTNQPTYYFRTLSLDLPYSTAGAGLRVHHFTDDAAVFYVNGARVGNYQLTNDPVYYTNYSNGGTSETVVNPFTTMLSGSSLVPGVNTIAMEVHQQNATSSDILAGGTFVALLKNFNSPGPKLSIVNNGDGTVTLSWTPGGGTLQESTDLINWVNAPNQSNPRTFTPVGMKYYRVQ